MQHIARYCRACKHMANHQTRALTKTCARTRAHNEKIPARAPAHSKSLIYLVIAYKESRGWARLAMNSRFAHVCNVLQGDQLSSKSGRIHLSPVHRRLVDTHIVDFHFVVTHLVNSLTWSTCICLTDALRRLHFVDPHIFVDIHLVDRQIPSTT